MQWLPPVDRQITLFCLEGFTALEIEEITGMTANHAAVRMNRVRRKLAGLMAPKEATEMSGSPVPLEGLPAIWQRSNRHEVDPKLVLPLVQEKRRAFDELVRAQDVSGHLVTLAFAPLTAVMAWKARLPLTQAGMGLVTISLLFMALATWLQQRLLLDPGPRGATVREYHGRLASAYEQRIRVLRTAKWWAIPRGACVGARVPPVADGLGGDRTHDPPWLWVRYKYDVREAGKLEAKKAEVKALLGELGGEATT